MIPENVKEKTESASLDAVVRRCVSESDARANPICVCGAAKGRAVPGRVDGAAVCWRCFKQVAVPLKDFQGTFEEWQLAQAQNEKS